jgi:DNA-binding SARP family transcriptional activator/ATP/maltotriose-dependent transcriptional regulator MalT
MSPFPSHFVPRPRLTDPCRGEDVTVVVVEAAAGFGKSVLAAELVERWGAVPVEVPLEEGPVTAQLLAGRLRAAVERAGFRDAAGSMGTAGEDPASRVDAMLAGLAGERVAIVVDDAHHAARDAAVLLDRIAAHLAPPGHLVVLARALPPGAERLRRAEAVHLDAADLALRDEEALALCRKGFGVDASEEDASRLRTATGGWTAAAVLAAARAKRTSRRVAEVASAADPGDGRDARDAVASILDEALVSAGPDRRTLALLAPLPLLDRELVAIATGDPDLFDHALALGLPLAPAGGRWWVLPGPVREHLERLAPGDAASLVRAAAYYQSHGQLGVALQLLLAAGDDAAAAQLLSGDLDPGAIETLDVLELLAIYERLAPDVVAAHPRVTFHVLRSCAAAALLDRRARLMRQLDETVTASDDPVLRRAIDAEMAIDLPNVGQPEEAEALGRKVLEGTGPSEAMTRARALTAVGFGLCARREPDGRLSQTALAEAADVFDQAASLYRGCGAKEWVSGVAPPRALWTELGLGRAQAALDVLDDALGAVVGIPRRVGRLTVHRAQVLAEMGRFDEAEGALFEAERLGERYDPFLAAFAPWGLMAVASYRGDAEGVVRNAQVAESRRGDWWSAVGAEFLAEAADCHDRVGLAAPANELLARALAEPQRAVRWTSLAECALLARHGDPELAEQRLATVHEQGIFPKEYWRVTLLRAYAAWRRGDQSAGGLAARAFDEAARIGMPDAPLVKERELATSLLALAVATGSAAAAAFEGRALPMSLALLGRFELTRGGQPVPLGTGQSAQLLKLIAIRGGRVQAEQVLEALWPEADPTASRNRLRTVLGRLREVAPEVVDRDGDVLVLGPEVRLDLREFQREARQALSLVAGDPGAAVALAGSAIARYRGDLLPDDPYEEWADAPREAARQSMLDLLDLCAEAAAERGDLDDARRWVQRAIEVAPDETDRYLRAAVILDEQGRHGAALSVLRRARMTLATLGIELPTQPLESHDASAR